MTCLGTADISVLARHSLVPLGKTAVNEVHTKNKCVCCVPYTTEGLWRNKVLLTVDREVTTPLVFLEREVPQLRISIPLGTKSRFWKKNETSTPVDEKSHIYLAWVHICNGNHEMFTK